MQSTFFRVPKDPLLAHAHGVDLTEVAFCARRTRRQTCLFSASRLSWRVAPTHSQTAKALKSSQLTHSPPTRTPLSCCTWHGARTHTHSQVRPPLLPKRQRNATQRNTHRSAAAVERLWPHAFFFSSRLSLYESPSHAAARLALPTHTHTHTSHLALPLVHLFFDSLPFVLPVTVLSSLFSPTPSSTSR